jgi:hypothetical protein
MILVRCPCQSLRAVPYLIPGIFIPGVGKEMKAREMKPIITKITTAAIITAMVYPTDLSWGDFISTGSPR